MHRTLPLRLSALALLALAACSQADAPPAPAAAAPAPLPAASAPSNGFNDAIAWRELDDGLELASREHRPVMLVVHASWCPRCKDLKPKFQDAELTQLAQRFVMVNVDQDKVPQAEQYAPDGTYIPRVLFLSPETGEVDASLLNAARQKFRYFYMPNDDLVGMMKKALDRHGRT
jgi:protein-disulfide reductase (glutathione)